MNNQNHVKYVMPKVAIVMRDNGPLPHGVSPYIYEIREVKRTWLERILYGTFNLLGIIMAFSIFVASVSLTSYMLVSSTNSPTYQQMKTQEVPSNGFSKEIKMPEKSYVRTIEK